MVSGGVAENSLAPMRGDGGEMEFTGVSNGVG